jgi:hypothetical protein
MVKVHRSGSIVGHGEEGDSAKGRGTSAKITGEHGRALCGGTLWRQSCRSEAHRCDQIIKDGGASTTIAGARSMVGRSSWWSLSGGNKTTTEETDDTAENEHIRSRAWVTPEMRLAAAPLTRPHGPWRWQPGRHP